MIDLRCGDALAILPTIDAETVDAVITDPPYSSGGAFRGDRVGGTVAKYTLSNGRRDLPEFAGDTRDQRAYGYWCALWLGQCLRLVRPGGFCCLFTDWRQIATTIDAFQAGGFVYRGIVAWDKTEAARPMKGRFRNQCEFIVWGTRGPAVSEGPCLPGVFRVAVSGTEKLHTAGKPERLLSSVVQICPEGGTILDPFAGSGTTGVACVQTNRRFIGIEISPEYHAIAESRISAARAATPLIPA